MLIFLLFTTYVSVAIGLEEILFAKNDELLTVYDPSCIDIIDVWPPPYSILRPIFNKVQGDNFKDYVVKITFSRPLKFRTRWWWRRLGSPVSLSISVTKLLKFSPYYYVQHFYGSERTFLFYFRIPESMRYAP